MGRIILNIVIFIVVNAVGAFAGPFLYEIAAILHFFPHVPDSLQHGLSRMVFVGTPLVFILGLIVSIGFFIARGEKRFWLLGAPVYLPLLFAALVMVYFSFAAI